MPVLAVTIFQTKPDLTKEQLEEISEKSIKYTVSHAGPGFRCMYHGVSTTHPDVVGVYAIWDSLDAHHQFMHSPYFGGLQGLVAAGVTGPPMRTHFEIPDTISYDLKTALESPITMNSILPIATDKAADYLKWRVETLPQYGKQFPVKINALFARYSYEDPFTFYHIGGWNSEEDHYTVQKSPAYAAFREEMGKMIDPHKSVEIYHFALKKSYGDW